MDKSQTVVAQLSKSTKSIKHTLNIYRANLKTLFPFELGPFSSFFYSLILLWLIYYYFKQGLKKIEPSNSVAFIGYCIDYWFYIMVAIIVYSTSIKFFK
jgi:hypothetical protein